jgi:pyroglutamyl-peptidase
MRTASSPQDLSRCIVAALVGLSAVAATIELSGCATEPGDTMQEPVDPNAGLLRDFLDGKFDSAGHPLNSRVTEAEVMCATAGTPHDGVIRLDKACESTKFSGLDQTGELVVNVRLSVAAHAASGDIVRVALLGVDGMVIADQTLTTSRLRHTKWIDWPVSFNNDGTMPVTLRISPAAGATIDVDYVEVFPERFGLVLSPGSGPIVDTDRLVFELPRSHKVDKVEADGMDITAQYQKLVDAGLVKKTTTAFRTLVDVGVADLLPMRGDVAEVKIHAGVETARMQLRKTAPACAYEGDPAGMKVIVTGFQPFPADGTHDNVSGVAVTNLDVTQLHGAQVMRLVMPVEYDRSAAEVTDAIARCSPDLVISFGQGGGEIALEEVAYNLQDTGEVAGGVPDNRGIIRAAVPIDSAAPATRDTLLPIDAIEHALVAAGETPQHSRDPGRYICNNVMFADIGAMTGKGRGGFIHLPYTTEFDAATKARFAKVVQLAIQAAVDNH